MSQDPNSSPPDDFALARVNSSWAAIKELLGSQAEANICLGIAGSLVTYAAIKTFPFFSLPTLVLSVVGCIVIFKTVSSGKAHNQDIRNEAQATMAWEYATQATQKIDQSMKGFHIFTLALGAGLGLGILSFMHSESRSKYQILFEAAAGGACLIATDGARREMSNIRRTLYSASVAPQS